MSDQHAYYCTYCKILIGATSLAQLCVFVNDHNYNKHAGDCATWNPAGLSCSLNYTGPEEYFVDDHNSNMMTIGPPDPTFGAGRPSTPAYRISRLTRWGGEWGTAERPPNITAEDVAMLREGLVRW